MQRVSVRTLRAKLRDYINAGKPVAIGSRYEVRAILLPMPPHSTYDTKSVEAAIKTATATLRKSLTANELSTYKEPE